MSTSMRKQIEGIMESLERQGWKVRSGAKHWVVYPADKSQSPVVVPKNPSDPRGVKNVISELRKRGAQL